jgi:hypothetical protein
MKMKKTYLGILAVLIIGGGFAVKIWIDRPNDPQQFVNDALANSLAIESGKSQMNLQVTADAGDMGNAQIALAGNGVIANATEYIPTLDYQMTLDFTTTVAGQIISGKASGEIKIVDEVIYGELSEFTLDGADALGLPIETITPYIGKWYGVSVAKLKTSDPEIATVFEEQKAQQLAMREALKGLLAANDILLVKKMPISLSDVQPVEVTLNTDLIMSDAFLAEIGGLFTPALAEGTENRLNFDAAQKAKIKTVLDELTTKIKSTILLQVGRDDGFLRGYTATLNVNLADLEIPQVPTGTVSVVLTAQNSELNQEQTVTAPTDFEEVDPLQFVPAPTEPEVVLDENGMPVEAVVLDENGMPIEPTDSLDTLADTETEENVDLVPATVE